MSFYNKLGILYGKLTSPLFDFQANLNFKKERKRKHSKEKIKVGFMCQYIPSWGKIEPIYRIMSQNNDFETVLICVPMGIHNFRLDNPEDISNDTYTYFLEKGYNVVNALVGRNEWLDLEKLDLDYLFFTRPYNHYMPHEYSSKKISAYTKICVLLYGFTLIEDTYRSTLNKDFFRNVYMYFAENTYAMRKNISHFKRSHEKGFQKSVYVGMAGLEEIMVGKDAYAPAWNFSRNEVRVIWTPRWTTDKALGGSNYFMYKDSILDFAKENQDMDFLLRPHPLMFDNFIKTGEMTKEEVIQYKESVDEIRNVQLDGEEEYSASIWASSLLVSDISSFIGEYFITGKPIIYCASNMEVELSENAKELISGCYISYTEEETFKYIKQIKSGNDPLKNTRQKLIREIFGENIMDIPRQIESLVIEDYKTTN